MCKQTKQTKVDEKISNNEQVKMVLALDTHWDMYVVNWYDLKHHGKGFEKNDDKTIETMCADTEALEDAKDILTTQMKKYNKAHPADDEDADDDGPFYSEIEDITVTLADLADDLERYGEYGSAERIIQEVETLCEGSMLDLPTNVKHLQRVIKERKEKDAAKRVMRQAKTKAEEL
jgi:hypothetical protein